MKLEEIVVLTEMVADAKLHLHVSPNAECQPQNSECEYNIAGFVHHPDSGGEQNVVICFEYDEECSITSVVTKDGDDISIDNIENKEDAINDLCKCVSKYKGEDVQSPDDDM